MKLSVILFFFVILVAGCARPLQIETPPSQELQVTMQQARDHFEAVTRLQVQEKYGSAFQEAQRELQNAENHLRTRQYPLALQAAQKSLAAAQRIFRQFYRETVARAAQDAKRRIDLLTQEDPENPLQEFLPQLTEILDYSETLTKKPVELELTKVFEDLEKVTTIGRNTQNTMQQTLASDVSFDPGQYDLSDSGAQILATYCERFITGEREVANLYPDRRIVMTIKVIGYTDQMDFRAGTSLTRRLLEGAAEALPQNQIERRQYLNRRLSELRANTVSAYFGQCLTQKDPKIQFEQGYRGSGEAMPTDIPAPYPISDSRRRICKIYSYVLVH